MKNELEKYIEKLENRFFDNHREALEAGEKEIHCDKWLNHGKAFAVG